MKMQIVSLYLNSQKKKTAVAKLKIKRIYLVFCRLKHGTNHGQPVFLSHFGSFDFVLFEQNFFCEKERNLTTESGLIVVKAKKTRTKISHQIVYAYAAGMLAF